MNNGVANAVVRCPHTTILTCCMLGCVGYARQRRLKQGLCAIPVVCYFTILYSSNVYAVMSSAEDLRTIPAESKRNTETQNAAGRYATCLSDAQTKTTCNGKQFTVLTMTENSPGYMSAQRLLDAAVQDGIPLVPFLSCGDLLIAEKKHTADELQVYAWCYGIFVGFCGDICQQDKEILVRVTSYLFNPYIIEQLSRGSNPKRVDTSQLKYLKAIGIPYEAPPVRERADSISLDEGIECIVCFTHEPSYMWSNCKHDNDGVHALLCHKGYNNVRRHRLGSAAIRGSQPTLPCYFCRTPGKLMKAVKSCLKHPLEKAVQQQSARLHESLSVETAETECSKTAPAQTAKTEGSEDDVDIVEAEGSEDDFEIVEAPSGFGISMLWRS